MFNGLSRPVTFLLDIILTLAFLPFVIVWFVKELFRR